MKLKNLAKFFDKATEVFEYNINGKYIINHTSFGVDEEDNVLTLCREGGHQTYIDLDTDVTVQDNYILIHSMDMRLKLYESIEVNIDV